MNMIKTQLLLLHSLLKSLLHPDPLDLLRLLQANVRFKLIDLLVTKLVNIIVRVIVISFINVSYLVVVIIRNFTVLLFFGTRFPALLLTVRALLSVGGHGQFHVAVGVVEVLAVVIGFVLKCSFVGFDRCFGSGLLARFFVFLDRFRVYRYFQLIF